ncbi:MAG: hypothetical protein ACXVC6_11880 [Bacteroidia bacterium]
MKTIQLNRTITSFLAVGVIILVSAFQSGDIACDQKALKDNLKKSLLPYKYDLAKVTRLMVSDKRTMKEIEVPLFIGEKYRLAFNTEALPKNVIINLYNRDKDHKNRKLVFSTKDSQGKKEYFFDYSFANKIFIDYDVPPKDSTDATSGCAVFMLGYK